MRSPTVVTILDQLRQHAVDAHGVGADKVLLAYSMACALLRNLLGESWAAKHLFRQLPGDPFLDFDSDGSDQRWMYTARVVALAEAVLNLAAVPGAAGRFGRLASVGVEDALAELLGAGLLYRAEIPFRFVVETGVRGADYDVAVTPASGDAIACEMKCKRLETVASAKTLRRTLQKAVGQLPVNAPGLAFVQVPHSWLTLDQPKWISTTIERAFRDSSRLAGLVLFWDGWTQLPSGTRLQALMIRVERNWASPHVWHAGLQVLDLIDRNLIGGNNWIDLQEEACRDR